MLSEKMVQLGTNRSVIRDLFEYGNKRKAEIGAENVFDWKSECSRTGMCKRSSY